MVDTLTPAQRSERMSRIRSRDTKPEIALRKAGVKDGMTTLRRAGLANVRRGITSIEEVLRVSASDDQVPVTTPKIASSDEESSA